MKHLSRLTSSLALTLFCFGNFLFIFGPCLTEMARTFDVPVGQFGLLWTFYAVGLLPAVLLTGYCSEVWGRRPLLLGAVALMAISCAALAASPAVGPSPNFWLAMGAMALAGIGGGVLQTIANAAVADDNRPAPGFAINAVLTCFAVGAVLGPAGASLLLRAGIPWPYAFHGLAALFVLLFLAMMRQRFPKGKDEPLTLGIARELLRTRMLWLLIGVTSLYVGAEASLNTWISPFLERELGAPRGTAGLAVSAFWVMMIVGRVGTSVAVTRCRLELLMMALAFGGAAAGIAVARAGSQTGGLITVALTGLFMSGITGLTLTDATRHFAQHRGAVYGLMLSGIALGSVAMPALMGMVATRAGLRAAMAAPPCLLACIGLLYLARTRFGSRGRGKATEAEDGGRRAERGRRHETGRVHR